MKLNWEGNQKYNQDISEATIWTIEKTFKITIHKYVGCGDALFFSCPEFRINLKNLHTENFDEAENKVMSILQNRLDELAKNVEYILKEYNR